MDKLPLSTLADAAKENEDRRSRNADVLSPDAQEPQDNWYSTRESNHESVCPFSVNLTTLMFIVVSDLSEAQRETSSHCS